MNTVTTINLAGTAFQVEDPGYATLKSYLDDAKRSLAGNPDEAEIIGDIERAIAEKCRRYTSAHKNVITTAEAEAIVAEMGPVSGETAAEQGGASNTAAQKPKRLYRIVEGEMVAGVANGLAAYFDIDVVLVRILFILLLVVTGGGFAFAYVLGWVFIPAAETAAQVAAASGAPFNAQEIVDRVKAEYAHFEEKHGAEWRAQWKGWRQDLDRKHENHKEWKRRMKAEKRRRAYEYHYEYRPGPSWVGELFGIVVFSFFAWYGYHHFPALHDFMDAAWNLLNRVVDIITNAIAKN